MHPILKDIEADCRVSTYNSSPPTRNRPRFMIYVNRQLSSIALIVLLNRYDRDTWAKYVS